MEAICQVPPEQYRYRFGSLHYGERVVVISVTRSGDLLNFGQLLKPYATINLPNYLTFLGNFCKVLKSITFLVKSFLRNFYRHLAIFSGHTAPEHLILI